MHTLSKRPDTIVLVHGFWVTPRSWGNWITRYEAQGYRVLAPAYPGLEVEVEALNRDLSQFERIKRFRVLPREFTIESGELTPTLKVKRRVIDERFGDLIDELYE